MSKKMLIDASHPEETRVVIVDHNRVEELDFESRNKRQLRGNVYLARVTRVEPSLQAAFIEYGGNRHGFLAFSEIHPDYYQIPYEDRMAILEEDEEHSSKEDEAESETDDSQDVERDENVDPDVHDAADENDAEVADEQAKVASTRRKRISRRRYKIQEVMKRGQILLVQAVKEERGNKGAAMTTYLSLAGRYCVLMPNTPRGGGISRKIANGSDRKRLKSVMSELEVPQGMGVIVRTAGAKRTKAEIKRDYEYLSRLWGDIRETTLKSIAPALIHEEGNLVKRSIRDLYNKDIDEVLVEGEEAYKTAKAFIKMLMPSHAKFVKQYKEDIPLFLRYSAESQIENSLSPLVQLKSGGYLVIHPTEALVSVDVNSGRSTKERNVERTALKTNLEAAEEVARQMRLRDLAGLIVIDFIDMDENKNNRAVERRMKDSLTQDRARIQTSRISQFGLMEISRQRRRRSLLEGSTTPCPHCTGVGRKRTVESSALAAIRAVEETAARGEAQRIRLKVSADVASYLVNEKRDLLTQVDQDMGVFTEVLADDELIRPHFEIEVLEKKTRKGPDPLDEIEKEFRRQRQKAQNAPKKQAPKSNEDDESDEDDSAEDDSEKSSNNKEESSDNADEKRSGRRRSRRGRRGGRGRSRSRDENQTEDGQKDDTGNEESSDKSDETKSDKTPDGLEVIKPKTEDEGKPKSRRRRATRKAPARKSGDESSEKDSAKQDNASKQDAETADGKAESKEDAKSSRSSRRRKAPTKASPSNESASEKATEAKSEPESESGKKSGSKREQKSQPKSASKSRRRAAPSRQPKADEETVKPTKPKQTRKAPAKKVEAESSETKAKPARKRKAPAKTPQTPKAAKIPEKADTVSKIEPAKSNSRRRAAPKKKPSMTAEDSSDVTTAEKPKAKKEPAKTPATKKPAAKKAPAKRRAPAKKPSEAPKGEPDTAKAKPASRRAAPSKGSETATNTRRTRKAPTKKASTESANPKPEPDPVPAPTPASSVPSKAQAVENRTEDKSPSSDSSAKKKKRGWFGLKR